MKCWGLSLTISAKPAWGWGCIACVDSEERHSFVVDAHRCGKSFIVHADEKLAAFFEPERVITRFALNLIA